MLGEIRTYPCTTKRKIIAEAMGYRVGIKTSTAMDDFSNHVKAVNELLLVIKDAAHTSRVRGMVASDAKPVVHSCERTTDGGYVFTIDSQQP